MKEQIQVAVKWWGDQLRHRTKQDNGDVMTTMLATLVAPDGVNAANVDEFEIKLGNLLPEHLGKTWNPEEPNAGSYCRVLECDYHPGHILRTAAMQAGIQPECPPFPMKTVMWINPDSVKVSHGYCAEIQTLWSNTEPQLTADRPAGRSSAGGDC